MADERTVQKEDLKKAKTLKPDSNTEVNQQMDNVFKRMMFIGRYKWDEATPVSSDLDSFLLPGAYFNFASKKAEKVCQPMTVNNILANYGFCRFDMRIRIQINSSKMASGLLLVYFEPFLFKERQGYVGNEGVINFPHIFINVCESTSAEFVIPWCNMRDYFPIYWDHNAEYNYFGYLHIRPWTSIRVGATTSASATVSVYMGFENWEVHQQVNPKMPAAITFTQDIIPDDYPYYGLENVHPTPEDYFIVKRALSNVEMQMEAGIGEVLAAAPEVGAVLMEHLAKAMSRLAADAPLANAVPANARLEVANVPAHGDGPKNGKVLGLTSCRQTPMKNRFLDSIAPSGYGDLLKMESYVYTFFLNVSNKENDSLFTWNVCPMMSRHVMDQAVKGVLSGEKIDLADSQWKIGATSYNCQLTQVSPTMLAYLAMGHLWWRGSLNWRFQAVKTTMHTARLGLRYQPSGGVTGKENECQKISQPTVIWDLQESDELKLTTEYAAPQPFLSTKYWGISGNASEPIVVGNFACGTAEMYVVNPMKVGTGVSTTVPINVYVSAGPDFEFAGTSDLASVCAIGKNPSLKLVMTGGEDIARRTYYNEFLWHRMTYEQLNIGDLVFIPSLNERCKIGVPKDHDTAVRILFGLDKDYFNVLTRREDGALKRWKEVMQDRKNSAFIHPPRGTRLTYQAALHFVCMQQFETLVVNDVLTLPMKKALMRGLACAHMREHLIRATWLPDLSLFPVMARSADGSTEHMANLAYTNKSCSGALAEMQMDKGEVEEGLTHDAPKVKGINPFTDGTTTDIASVHDLYGENFKDMYQRLRRQYCVCQWVYPRYRDTSDGWFDGWQQDLGRMNPEEFNEMYWEVVIPVTPSQMIGYLGDGNAYFTIPGNAGKFCDSQHLGAKLGASWGNDYNMTPLTWLSEIFTFWRGDMRFSFFFPDNVETYATVVHVPDDYCYSYTSLTTASAVARYSNFGNVLYKGNVMGELSVEVPWCSKYPRLVLSRYKNSAITQNGTIHMFVKMRRSEWQRGLRGIPPNPQSNDVKESPVDPIKFWLYMGFGETAEMLVPRAAPNVWLYSSWYNHIFTDKQIYDNLDTITASASLSRIKEHEMQDNVTRKIVPTTDGGYEKPMRVSDRKHPVVKGDLTATFKRDYDYWLKTRLPGRMEHVYKPTPPPEKKEAEMQGADDIPVTKEVYEAYHVADQVDGQVYKLSMEDVVNGGLKAVAAIPLMVDKFNRVLEQTSNTWSITDSAMKALKNAGDKTSELVGNVVPKVWDATRITLIGYAIHSFLQAEDMNSKLMALMSGALGLGLNYDIVKKSFDWLLTSITSVFSTQVNIENTIEQQDEDDVTGEFAQFVLRHAETLKVVASAVGAFALFSFCPSGTNGMTGKVQDFASRMVGKLRNLSIVGTGIKTFEWLFEWIGKMFKSAFEWACDLATGGMLTKKALTVQYPEVLDWLSHIECFAQEGEITKAVWDYEVQLQIWRLMDKGTAFADGIGKKEQFLANYITQGCKKLQIIHEKTIANKMSVPFRKDPYCIWLYGAPGVGKSAMANSLCDFISDFIDLPHQNRVYSRNEDEEFWSGYIGQPVVMIDDICQNKKGHAVQEFIRMKSNNELQVPMASIEDKGRKFRSQMIIATSNMGYPVPENMASAEALWRRRNLLVNVIKDPLGRIGAHYCRFHIMDPVHQDRVLQENLSYADLAAYAAQYVRDYLHEQTALVGANLKGQKIPKLWNGQCNVEAVQEKFLDTITSMYVKITTGITPSIEDLEFLNAMDDDTVARYIRAHHRFNLDDIWKTVKKAVDKYKDMNAQRNHELIKTVEVLAAEAKALADAQMEDSASEEFNRLRDTAWDVQYASERKYAGYKKLQQTKYYETDWTHVANEHEIKNVIRDLEPNLTNDQVEQKIRQWKEVFNAANNLTPADSVAHLTPKGFSEGLKNEDFRNMFVLEENEWKIKPTPDEPNEWQFSALSYWETCLQPMKVEDRNKVLNTLIEKVKNETVVKTPSISGVLKLWVKKKTAEVETFFEAHPWLFKILKVGGFVAGFFLGYRLMRWICGDFVDKIERKLCSFFGMAKETRYVQYVKDKTIQVRDWTKQTALAKKISSMLASEVGGAETEADIQPLVTETLKNVLLPKIDEMNKVRKKGVPAAYFIGEGKKAIMQGSADQGADDVRDLVVGNFVRLRAITGDKMRNMLGVIVDRNYMLAPIHYFDNMEPRTEMTITCSNGKEREVYTELFDPEKLRQLEKLDAAIYQLGNGFRPKRKIIQHFMTAVDLPHVSRTSASLITLNKEEIIIQHNVDAVRRGQVLYKESLKNYVLNNFNMFEYGAGTTKGDCGSVLLARNTGIRKKILGMHTAGIPDRDLGYSVCVTAEMLQAAMDSYSNDHAFVDLPGEAEIQEAFAFTVTNRDEIVIPEGNFQLQGIIAKHLEVKNPVKTEIRKSPIHGLVREAVTEPSILSSRDPRWQRPSTPLYRAVEKYGRPSKPFYFSDAQYVAAEAASDWYAWKRIMDPRVLTDHEAVFGNELIPFCDRMNLQSSAGFPFVKWNAKKGKAWLYDFDAADGIKNEEYRVMYREREEKAKQRVRVPHLWISCLKDERRKKSKIEEGKTRAFMIAGADWVQLFRKYFLSFCVNFYANAGSFYSAVGVDPFSYDWTVIFQRITSLGDKGFGIDYKEFDGLTDADLMYLFVVEINKWYKVYDKNWKIEDDNVRFTLISDCVHSLFLVGCLLLWKSKGNPSGNPITTIINSFINACYLRLAFLTVMRYLKRLCKQLKIVAPNEILASIVDSMLEGYRLGVREITYGDDGVIGVAEWLERFFNLKTVTSVLAEHGIVSTAEDKDAELYEVQPLTECTFLKCGFVPMPGRESVILAPIAQNTIYELTNWVRKSNDDVGQMRVNLQDAMRFAFHWGAEFYWKLGDGINNALHEKG
ncbi:polyprotein, partial [Rainier virus]